MAEKIMNRRGFFKAFSVLGAAASLSPMVFVPKFEPVHWKKIVKLDEWCAVVNPEWINAPYEVEFIGVTDNWMPGYPPRFMDQELTSQVAPFIVSRTPKRFLL